jgi:hypothetical protein
MTDLNKLSTALNDPAALADAIRGIICDVPYHNFFHQLEIIYDVLKTPKVQAALKETLPGMVDQYIYDVFKEE